MYLSCLVVETQEVPLGPCNGYMYRKPNHGHAKATTGRVKGNSNVEEKDVMFMFMLI